ncbi:MAG TPA: hypothetical protein HA257_06040 [Candidatus Methanoperedenaceae archaeon]|nr:hypothetical protein [Candidatus Methanoperedenaceae archaeon]
MIDEIKPIPSQTLKNIHPKNKENRSYKEYDLEVKSASGKAFRIRIRENILNVLDFSVILIYVDEKRKYHILRRYNGKHIHRNQIEKNKFRDFHIHMATGRYQEAGFRIEGYAEVTDSYNNWKDALTKMLKDCNFKGDMSLNGFN